MKKNIKIFISYSHKDESYKDELTTFLAGLKRSGILKAGTTGKFYQDNNGTTRLQKALMMPTLYFFL